MGSFWHRILISYLLAFCFIGIKVPPPVYIYTHTHLSIFNKILLVVRDWIQRALLGAIVFHDLSRMNFFPSYMIMILIIVLFWFWFCLSLFPSNMKSEARVWVIIIFFAQRFYLSLPIVIIYWMFIETK